MSRNARKKRSRGNTNSPSKTNRHRAWFFTFNNYEQKHVTQLCEHFEKIEYVFQEEKSDSGTKHLQGCVRFPNAVQMNFQELLPKEIHWEKCRNWKNAKKYCSKRDTRIGKVYTNILNLKIRKRIIDPMEGKIWKNWQLDIQDIIKEKVDDRKIYWFWESKGGIGKSTFCKHIVMNYNAILVGGKKNDIFYAVGIMDENKDIDIVLIDVSRQDYNYVNYSAIESLKNGMMFSGKYESKQILINPPHIIIFANYEPDTSMLSLDRYIIKNIGT